MRDNESEVTNVYEKKENLKIIYKKLSENLKKSTVKINFLRNLKKNNIRKTLKIKKIN